MSPDKVKIVTRKLSISFNDTAAKTNVETVQTQKFVRFKLVRRIFSLETYIFTLFKDNYCILRLID